MSTSAKYQWVGTMEHDRKAFADQPAASRTTPSIAKAKPTGTPTALTDDAPRREFAERLKRFVAELGPERGTYAALHNFSLAAARRAFGDQRTVTPRAEKLANNIGANLAKLAATMKLPGGSK